MVEVGHRLTSVLSQTARWVRSAVIPHSDDERVKTLDITKSVQSAILIIAQINEGRELDSM